MRFGIDKALSRGVASAVAASETHLRGVNCDALRKEHRAACMIPHSPIYRHLAARGGRTAIVIVYRVLTSRFTTFCWIVRAHHRLFADGLPRAEPLHHPPA